MAHHRQFTVKGTPFFSIGGQLHNSTGYSIGDASNNARHKEDEEIALNSLKTMGANTVAIPVCWEVFEAREGEYNEQYVKDIISFGRDNDLHIVLLWFGTWKNGQMEYTPSWVKQDTERFRRVICKDGTKTAILSPHCNNNLEADKRAFCKMMEIVKEADEEYNTVIGIQVENEPGGIAATRRDFGESGERDFRDIVPEQIVNAIEREGKGYLYECWNAAGRKRSGTWAELFGFMGAEACTAWAMAKYMNEIAGAGKKIYDIFMYINVWTDRNNERGRSLAGVDYPCGGAVSKVLPIYYEVASELDAISPDIYEVDPEMFAKNQDCYARDRERWPLYVPESHRGNLNATMIFRAIGKHHAIGYHIFGIENCLDAEGKLLDSAKGIRDTFQILRSVQDIIPEYYDDTNDKNLYAFYQKPGQDSNLLRMKNWDVKVSYCGVDENYSGWVATDYRHASDYKKNYIMHSIDEAGSRGILFQVNENEYYLVGCNIRLYFQRLLPEDGSIPMNIINMTHLYHNICYLTVEEGHFENGKYVIDRKRSGDEVRHGLWAEPDCGVIHFVLADESV